MFASTFKTIRKVVNFLSEKYTIVLLGLSPPILTKPSAMTDVLSYILPPKRSHRPPCYFGIRFVE